MWREKFDKDFAKIPGEGHPAGQQFGDWLDLDEYTKHQDMFIRHGNQGKDTEKVYQGMKKTRRAIKQWWYDNADHDYIQNNVIAIHSLNYYGNMTNTFKQGVEFEHDMTDLNPQGFLEKYSSKRKHKDLSLIHI